MAIAFVVFASRPSFATDAPAAPSAPTPAPREEPWAPAIGLGGGVGAQGHASGEVTFSPGLMGPHVSVGYVDSRSGGRVYIEGGANLILTLAAGIGYHGESSPASRWGFHIFAGLPLPIIGWGPDGVSTPFTMRVHVAPIVLYAEPFYRPEFRSGAAVDQEVGVLLKLRIAITRWQWSLPGYDVMSGLVI